jgi:hypothetical protein
LAPASFISANATEAPRTAKPRARPSPKPLAPPVTTTRFPAIDWDPVSIDYLLIKLKSIVLLA